MSKELLEMENKFLRELVQSLTNKLEKIEEYLDYYARTKN